MAGKEGPGERPACGKGEGLLLTGSNPRGGWRQGLSLECTRCSLAVCDFSPALPQPPSGAPSHPPGIKGFMWLGGARRVGEQSWG